MVIMIEADTSGFTTTTLTGTVDQAVLMSLLRQIYYLSFPLIAVNCIQLNEKKNDRGHLTKQKQTDLEMYSALQKPRSGHTRLVAVGLYGICELTGLTTITAYRRQVIATAIKSKAVEQAYEYGAEVIFLAAADEQAGRVY